MKREMNVSNKFPLITSLKRKHQKLEKGVLFLMPLTVQLSKEYDETL
ncbi:hypothetical protein HS9_03924 [Bacillus velezensis]|nr:hypothetical protein HS9_03924 [Bacillus velezensis]